MPTTSEVPSCKSMATNGEVNSGSDVFLYSNKDFVFTTSSEHDQKLMLAFDSVLLKKWETARDTGIFLYQVEDVITKILPGKYKLVVQINTKRNQMKRNAQEISCVVQPFDPEKFNFTRIKKSEILAKVQYKENYPKGTDNGKMADESIEGTLIINNAPICYSHSLLIPFLTQRLPQVINHKDLYLALHMMLLSQTPNFRIAYNSPGGYASVNHLHYHLYHLPYPLYIETAECQKLAGPCYVFKDYYAPGFVFQLENEDLDGLIRSLTLIVKLFIDEEMAHNMFITRGTSLDKKSPVGIYNTIRVIIWARKPFYGIKDNSVFAPAVCELAGHVPVYSSDHWFSLSEEDVTSVMRITSEEYFAAMAPKVIRLFSNDENSS